MIFEETRILIDRFLKAAHGIASGPNSPKTKSSRFSAIVEATLRRDYFTLYTVMHLADGRTDEIPAFGGSSMDLSRRALEDMISLEYILLKGKEKMTKRFQDYLAVQDKLDLDYYKAAGLSISAEDEKLIIDAYEKVKKQFLMKSSRYRWNAWNEVAEYLGTTQQISIDMDDLENEFERRYPHESEEVSNNWSGAGVESMIIELVKSGRITKESEKQTLLHTYKMGNNKNHFSPQDLIIHLFGKEFDALGKSDFEVSILFILIANVRIAKTFIDEFHVANDIAKEIDSIWNDIVNAK